MIWAVVPAAGFGRRFGSEIPKQYARIGGKPLLRWTLERLAALPQLDGLMVVLSRDDGHWPGWTEVSGKPLHTAVGGAERSDSVLAGLHALPATVADRDFVLVHDAARPCVRQRDIERLVELCRGTDGGLLAAPVRDTLKLVADDYGPDAFPLMAERTVPRQGLWRALTPQMFRRGALTRALQAAGERGERPTDEAAAMEASGLKPMLVEGAEDNIKVTTAHDLALAEYFLTVARADTGS